MILGKLLKVVGVMSAVLGALFAALSYLFCTSHYADEELKGIFTGDDAVIVIAFGVLSLVCVGAPFATLAWRRWSMPKGRPFYFLAGTLLLSGCQLYLVTSRESCVSLAGIIRGEHRVMVVEPNT